MSGSSTWWGCGVARRTVAELKAAIAARLPDNTTGEISPAILRAVLVDLVDSFAVVVPAEREPRPNAIRAADRRPSSG